MNRAFTKPIRIYEKYQKNLGESTHPIDRTIFMQMMTASYSGADGKMYVKVHIWVSQRVPRWYASVMSSFENPMGPAERSAYQIACRMQGKASPNCIKSGAKYLSLVTLTLVVPSLGFSNRLKMRRGWRCAWGTAAMRESLGFILKICTASAAGRRIMNPSCTFLFTPLRMNTVIYGEHAGA